MERLLDPKEAAKIMAVTSRTIKEWLRRGELTGVKVRKLWRIRESDLEQFIQKGIEKTSNSPSGPPSPPCLPVGRGERGRVRGKESKMIRDGDSRHGNDQY